MTDTYQAALNGTLRSPWYGQPEAFHAIQNDTPLRLEIYWVGYDGYLYGINPRTGAYEAGYPGVTLEPGGTTSQITWLDAYFVVKASYSGAFVAVLQVSEPETVHTVTGGHLLDPNDIGEIPRPSREVVIPPNGPRVLVGTGKLESGNSVTREQYWQRLPDSYSLAPGENRTVSYTITSGMEESSSDTETTNASVGADISAGWGPFSASVSASLSQSSTTTQQLTVNTQTTSYVSNKYSNPEGEGPVMLLFWQLTDVLTVFDPDGKPLSSVITKAEPSVISGPFEVDKLDKPDEVLALSPALRARRPQRPSIVA